MSKIVEMETIRWFLIFKPVTNITANICSFFLKKGSERY